MLINVNSKTIDLGGRGLEGRINQSQHRERIGKRKLNGVGRGEEAKKRNTSSFKIYKFD